MLLLHLVKLDQLVLDFKLFQLQELLPDLELAFHCLQSTLRLVVLLFPFGVAGFFLLAQLPYLISQFLPLVRQHDIILIEELLQRAGFVLYRLDFVAQLGDELFVGLVVPFVALFEDVVVFFYADVGVLAEG